VYSVEHNFFGTTRWQMQMTSDDVTCGHPHLNGGCAINDDVMSRWTDWVWKRKL